MTDYREIRAAHFASHGVKPVDLRADSEGDGYTFIGYASMYDTAYSVRDALGEYDEIVRAGAFTRSVNNGDDVRLLLNHDGVPLARTKSGTLTLDPNDPAGLRCEAHLDASSPLVASIKSAMDRGDLDQMSFAFSATRQKWSPDYAQRDILEAKLFDVSVVTYPASPSTEAAMRSEDTEAAEARTLSLFADAQKQMRATGVVDGPTRDLLLQVLGAIDAATETIEDATEVLEMALGVTEEADFSDAVDATCDCINCVGMDAAMAPSRGAWLMLQRAALDL